MKVKVTLPGGYDRSYLDKKKGSFYKSAPAFGIDMFDDEGKNISDPYPHIVQMGPEMYEFLSKIAPGIAARRNEDLTYEGNVMQKPRTSKAQYEYYGLNPKFEVGEGSRELSPGKVGLIGYGDEEVPSDLSQFGTDPFTGANNYLYSKMIKPAQVGALSKSKILSNILNDSWDFSPLFAPYYAYKDPKYDSRVKDNKDLARKLLAARKGLEIAEDGRLYRMDNSKGRFGERVYQPDFSISEIKDFMQNYKPRTSDFTVRRYDSQGRPMFTKEGKPWYMSIPRTQDLPIYNFKHPAWGNDPEAAWNMVNEPADLLTWEKWGTAPSFADYSGKTSKTDTKGIIRERDYAKANRKIAATPGYFEDAWDTDTKKKAVAEEAKLNDKDYKAEQKSIARQQALQDEVNAEGLEEKNKKAREEQAENKQASHKLSSESGYVNKADQKQYYRSLARKLFDENKYPEIAEQAKRYGLSRDDWNDLFKYIRSQGFEKYNKMDNEEEKMLNMLKDYAKSGNTDVSNILKGVQEPF